MLDVAVQMIIGLVMKVAGLNVIAGLTVWGVEEMVDGRVSRRGRGSRWGM